MAYDKEKALCLLRQEKTERVVEELIKLNGGLMGKQLRKFGLTHDPEAISYAYEALYKAIITYNETKHSAFSTYATICIYNRLGSYVRHLKTAIMVNTISYNRDDHIATMESAATADGALMQQAGVEEIKQAFNECYNKLTAPMHVAIVDAWKNSDFTITHTEIANKLDCSRSYASQVITKFRGKLKSKLEVQRGNNYRCYK